MLEIEMKFPVKDFDVVERYLKDGGSAVPEKRVEVDAYFNAPDRDFGKTDEALRLRQIGSANFVTYKGPKRDAQTKTRTEIEVELSNGDAAAAEFRRLLTHLGYRFTGEVRKRREIYRIRREGFSLEVCLDQVEDLGQFVELEIKAEEVDLDRGREVLLQTAKALELTASERRSYLELLLARPGTAEGGR